MKTGHFKLKGLLLLFSLSCFLLPGCTEILFFFHRDKTSPVCQEPDQKKASEESKDDQLRSPAK